MDQINHRSCCSYGRSNGLDGSGIRGSKNLVGCTSFHIDILRSGRNITKRRNGSKTKFVEAMSMAFRSPLQIGTRLVELACSKPRMKYYEFKNDCSVHKYRYE